jgi:hypothetical protein
LFEAEKVFQNLLLQLQFASQQNFGIIPKLQVLARELYYSTFDRSVVTAIIFSVFKTTQLTKCTDFHSTKSTENFDENYILGRFCEVFGGFERSNR